MKTIIFAISASFALLAAPAAFADQGDSMNEQSNQAVYEQEKEAARLALQQTAEEFKRDLDALSQERREFIARHPDADKVGLSPESAAEYRDLERRLQLLVERSDAMERQRLEFRRRYHDNN